MSNMTALELAISFYAILTLILLVAAMSQLKLKSAVMIAITAVYLALCVKYNVEIRYMNIALIPLFIALCTVPSKKFLDGFKRLLD